MLVLSVFLAELNSELPRALKPLIRDPELMLRLGAWRTLELNEKPLFDWVEKVNEQLKKNTQIKRRERFDCLIKN